MEGSSRGPLKSLIRAGARDRDKERPRDMGMVLDHALCPADRGFRWAFIQCPGKDRGFYWAFIQCPGKERGFHQAWPSVVCSMSAIIFLRSMH